MSKKQKSSKRTQSAHCAENRNRSWARGEERHRINRDRQFSAWRANLARLNTRGYNRPENMTGNERPSNLLRSIRREEHRTREAAYYSDLDSYDDYEGLVQEDMQP